MPMDFPLQLARGQEAVLVHGAADLSEAIINEEGQVLVCGGRPIELRRPRGGVVSLALGGTDMKT